MYERILAPTDGGEGSVQAADHAFDLAKQYGATVHAVYVIEPVYNVEVGIERVMEALEREGKAALADFKARADDRDVTAITELRQGSAHQEILDYATEEDVDLIVMATHGRTGLNRYLLGSVTERVVRLADVPVLTTRLRDDDK